MNQEPIDPKNIKKFDVNLIELDPEEVIICEIRKHSIGLILTIFTGAMITLFVLMATGIFSGWLDDNPDTLGEVSSLVSLGVLLIGILVAVGVAIFTFIGAYIYEHNVVLVTSDKIAQVLYRTIFDRKVSQLSISDVQDVTVMQKGMFARIFHYGTLTIETAGEQQNYTFSYAPNPYQCSKDIISAHEANAKKHGN